MKALTSARVLDRALVDAVREALGLSPLYETDSADYCDDASDDSRAVRIYQLESPEPWPDNGL